MTNKEVMHWINVCCLNYILTDPDSEEKILEARDAISRLIKNSLQWIPINERPPENDEPVLISYGDIVFKAVWDDRIGHFTVLQNAGKIDMDLVTAWMPLPEPYNIRKETNK